MSYVGFEALTAVVMKSSVFWDITQCNPLKINRCFEGTALLDNCFMLVSCLAYSSALKM
jgi:hypothetical protein